MAYVHTTLQFMKGIPVLPNTTPTPATLGLGTTAIDLLNSGSICIDSQDGYVLQRPSLKNGGNWLDSQLMPGRFLIAGQPANVTETIRAKIFASSLATLSGIQQQLEKYINDVVNFWTQAAQIEPCYIANQVQGEPHVRYALLMNVDIQYGDLDTNAYAREVTFSIEREPYWRAEITPGSSPMLWTLGLIQNTPYNTTPRLDSPSSLVYKTVNNKCEFNDANYLSLKSENFIDIDASDIPGDAPALCSLYIDQSVTAVNSGFLGLKTAFPDRLPTGGGSALPVYANTRNAPDSTLGTNASLVNDTGGVRSRTSGTAQRGEVSFAAGTAAAVRFTFTNPQYMNQLIGRWAVFLRCRQVNGTFGQITMYLSIAAPGETSTTGGVILPTTSPQLIGTSGNTANWGVAYMGNIAFPIQNAKASMLTNGAGLTTAGDLEIALVAARSAGAGVLYIADLILIPIDEGGGEWKNLGLVAGGGYVLDNTGYSTHGDIELYQGIAGTGLNNRLTSYLGTQIQLQPGIQNRIYFLFGNPSDPDDTTQSQVSSDTVVALNIVPRWVGVCNV